ncbi:MAG: hypothetical protein BJ554DRAFT_1888, partial [Olpidium bornovanus]
ARVASGFERRRLRAVLGRPSTARGRADVGSAPFASRHERALADLPASAVGPRRRTPVGRPGKGPGEAGARPSRLSGSAAEAALDYSALESGVGAFIRIQAGTAAPRSGVKNPRRDLTRPIPRSGNLHQGFPPASGKSPLRIFRARSSPRRGFRAGTPRFQKFLRQTTPCARESLRTGKKPDFRGSRRPRNSARQKTGIRPPILRIL